MKNKSIYVGGLALGLLLAACSNTNETAQNNVPVPEICELLSLPTTTDAKVSIDYVNDVTPTGGDKRITLPANQDITLKGWAADDIKKIGFSAIYAIVGEEVYKGSIAEERPDVQAYLGTDNAMLGFNITIPAQALADKSSFKLLFEGADHTYMSNPKTIAIAQPNGASKAEVLNLLNLPIRYQQTNDWNGGFSLDNNNGEPFSGTIKLDANGGFTVSGWVADAVQKKPISKIYAAINGKLYPFFPEGDRADVRAILGMGNAAPLSIEITLPVDAVKDASHVGFIAVSEDGGSRFPTRYYEIAK